MSEPGLVSHCLELLSPLGRTSSRRMFGGHALYVDGLCMALVLQDTLYLKVDDASRALFERSGCRPFIYKARNEERRSLGYYTAPEEAMESPAEMTPWARRALAAAVGARAKAPPRTKASVPKAAATTAPAGQGVATKAPARNAAATKAPAGKGPATQAPTGEGVASKAAARKAAKR